MLGCRQSDASTPFQMVRTSRQDASRAIQGPTRNLSITRHLPFGRAGDASLQCQRRLHHLWIIDHPPDAEAQMPDKRQHRLVIRQNLPLDFP